MRANKTEGLSNDEGEGEDRKHQREGRLQGGLTYLLTAGRQTEPDRIKDC